MKFLNDNEQA